MNAEEILAIANAYAAHTGRTLSGVGTMSCGNAKIFARLQAGRGANIITVERAYRWFQDNWPDDAPWPVTRPPDEGLCRNKPRVSPAAV